MTTDTKDLGNNADAIISATKLDTWTPIKMPLLIQGKTQNRRYEGRSAIVHNRTGLPFDICSDDYHIHKPEAVVRAVCEAIPESVATITAVKELHGGKSVVVEGQFKDNHHFNATHLDEREKAFHSLDHQSLGYQGLKDARYEAGFRKGQAIGINRMSKEFSVKIGNTVGNPCKVQCQGREIACLNGMTTEAAVAVALITHRHGGEKIVFEFTKILPKIEARLRKISEARDRLTNQQASLPTMRMALLEMAQPLLFEEVLKSTISKYGENTPEVNRSFFLDAINSNDLVSEILLTTVENREKASRFTRNCFDHLESQPLADDAKGTLWQPYMAATYVTDHKAYGRGEYAADNVYDSLNFGEASISKGKMLDTILTYEKVLTIQ